MSPAGMILPALSKYTPPAVVHPGLFVSGYMTKEGSWYRAGRPAHGDRTSQLHDEQRAGVVQSTPLSNMEPRMT